MAIEDEFLNHMIAQNTFFIMVERDALDSVFRYLQEEDFGNTLIKPRGTHIGQGIVLFCLI